MRMVHPLADEWGPDYMVFAASARVVLLTEPLASFLDCAVADGYRPVLMTSFDARIDTLASMALQRAGGVWALQAPDGATFDGLSGYRIAEFAELWGEIDASRERMDGFIRPIARNVGVVMFDVFTHQRAETSTVVGNVAAEVMEAIGGYQPRLCGSFEPLTDPWNTAEITRAAQRGMPACEVMYARGEDRSFCAISAGRTKHGIVEHSKGGVPIGRYPAALAPVLGTATDALSLLVDRFRATIGLVSLAEFDAGLLHGPHTRAPEVPLAALIGPRAVHDLRLDIDDLAGRHDIRRLGRARTPSLLVRFSRPDVGLWAQLVAFAHDVGAEKTAAAAGLDRVGRDAH